VRIFKDRKLLSTELLNITEILNSKGPNGLMALAFHPGYAKNHLIYVYYIDPQGDPVVGQFQSRPDATTDETTDETLKEDSLQVIIKIAQSSPNSNTGSIQFGADDLLYISTGDGSATAATQAAQSDHSLLGKLLRIAPLVSKPYQVPSDNPFNGVAGVLPEIWASGFHNPTHFTMDKTTNRIFLVDAVAPGASEIKLIEKGRNYGIPCTAPNCAIYSAAFPIVGGVVYRGSRIPALFGLYIFGDAASGTLWALREENNTWKREELLAIHDGKLTSIGVGPKGELYLTTDSGSLFQLTK
jgi:glucose/arabinose dehydrogenase